MANQRAQGASFTPHVITGVNTEQTILSATGVLHSIVAAAGAAAGTITVKIDGNSIALGVPANDSRSWLFDAKITTGLTITPSATTLSAIVTAD